MPNMNKLLLWMTWVGCLWAQPAPRPNILIVLADDLGYADLGFQGSKDIRTPHLDRLAAEGARFTNAYVTHAFCSPTRAGLMTGRYQQRFGHENNMLFNFDDEVTGLPLAETTMADRLGAAGYKTGLIGKWHLGAHKRFHPMKRGFQEMYGFVGGGHDYFDPGSEAERRETFIAFERDGKPVKGEGYLTSKLGGEAAAFVRRHANELFFLYLAFNAPHAPLQAPQPDIDRYASIADKNRRVYAAMVTAMDSAIGEVLKAIAGAGIEDRTLIIFLDDNGGPAGNASSNHPLRGTKRTLYEGGVRVPMAMKWPGRIPRGLVFEGTVSSLDVLPTVLSACRIKAADKTNLDGVDLLPYLTGKLKGSPHPTLYWRMFGGSEIAIRDGHMKLVRVVNQPVELYDLSKDMGERNNLALVQPQTVRRLEARLAAWNAQLATPLWPDHIYHLRANQRK
jgi:arylsulfatase A-like enzyme